MQKKEKKTIGWREWVKLPDLNVKFVKAKIDTGARTSSLHAYDVEVFRKRGQDYVRFKVHPLQRDTKKTVTAVAKVHEYRKIKSSSGHTTERPVIITEIELLGEKWPIELTLANRDEMGFRMLVGREGLRKRLLVDPGKSYYSVKPKKKTKKMVTKKTKNLKKKRR